MKVLQKGVYLVTQAEVLEMEKTWNDDDIRKDTDFTAHAFWVITEYGHDPEGYDDEASAIEDIEDIGDLSDPNYGSRHTGVV